MQDQDTRRTDWHTVDDALRRYRNLALSFRRGGLGEDYELAKEALEALERIRNPKLGILQKS
jgi:hypothetical protein